jgi:hypothetical protein
MRRAHTKKKKLLFLFVSFSVVRCAAGGKAQRQREGVRGTVRGRSGGGRRPNSTRKKRTSLLPSRIWEREATVFFLLFLPFLFSFSFFLWLCQCSYSDGGGLSTTCATHSAKQFSSLSLKVHRVRQLAMVLAGVQLFLRSSRRGGSSTHTRNADDVSINDTVATKKKGRGSCDRRRQHHLPPPLSFPPFSPVQWRYFGW